MTTPTREQILTGQIPLLDREKLLAEKMEEIDRETKREAQTQIKAALVRLCDALLRQGTEQDGNWGWPTFHKEIEEIKASLAVAVNTAAAQVEESEWQQGYEAGMKSAAPAIAVLQAAVVATIERCAQVAEEEAEAFEGDLYGVLRRIAAAIRKLKCES